MSSTFGEKIKISVFGESHGEGIGVVIDGLPAGETIDREQVLAQMARRAPGKDKTATPRQETDFPRVLSGMLDDTLTGAPLCAVIENTNTRSGDYSGLMNCPRPAHADYTAYIKYHAANDVRGGGHFSGRLTAPLVFAGAVCRQLLEKKGVRIAAHIDRIGRVYDNRFYPTEVDPRLMERLSASSFALIDGGVEEAMRAEVEDARRNLDSIGGAVECAVTGLPAGVGDPMFDGLEGVIAKAVFGVPAVKGVEFGAGFALPRGQDRDRDQQLRRNPRRNLRRYAADLPRGDQADALHRAAAENRRSEGGREHRAGDQGQTRPLHCTARRTRHRGGHRARAVAIHLRGAA